MLKVINGGFEPVRATKYSAYVDLFAREDVTIGAGETKMVKLGVKIDLSEIKDDFMIGRMDLNPYFIQYALDEKKYEHFLKSHYLEIALRSSLGVKGLIIANGIGIIDLDYPDEIGLIVHNPTTNERVYEYSQGNDDFGSFKISKGDKVAQCTLKEHKGYLMGYESDITREGGFGSTGK